MTHNGINSPISSSLLLWGLVASVRREVTPTLRGMPTTRCNHSVSCSRVHLDWTTLCEEFIVLCMTSHCLEPTHSDGYVIFTGIDGPDDTVKAALFYLYSYALSQVLERQLFWRWQRVYVKCHYFDHYGCFNFLIKKSL